jgi:outer membrane receptor protein involved in Fe transport
MDIAAAFLWLTLRLVAVPNTPRIAESIIVTSTPSIRIPTAVTTLNRPAWELTPAATVDDALRSVPGFSLFRRSSSRVANPTTQGVTLRGLAASGSSRALVMMGDVPLNDPVGGWVYWNRLPLAALDEAQVTRGASGDVFGPDAVGGTVLLGSRVSPGGRILLEGGTDETARVSAYAGGKTDDTTFFGSAEGFTTDGFVIVAPESRGPIDTAAGSRHVPFQGGVLHETSWGWVDARGGHFRESRRNGTPYQRNSTEITHVSGAIVGAQSFWYARGYAQTQHYEQTFSAVLPGRTAERPTSEQDIDATVVGFAVDKYWSRRLVDLSFSTRRVTSELAEAEFSGTGAPLPPTVIEPTQSSIALAGRWTWNRRPLSGGVSARTEWWQSTLDEPNRHVFFMPRVWFTYAVSMDLKFNVALQSGYRGPTINELYRPFRVGNTVTRANPLLEPEGVHGVEGGVSWTRGRSTIRGLGFWSRVDDAIVNVTLSSSGGVITRERQNAARIRARGAELELESRVGEALTLMTSTAYTDSTFVEGPLVGLRVPQVPRWHNAVGGRGVVGPLRWSAEYRFIDEQFDDDRNLFPLDESSMFDARVGWMLNRRIELFGAIENLFDEEQDVGRTPIRTIGLPRTSRVGMRFVF